MEHKLPIPNIPKLSMLHFWRAKRGSRDVPRLRVAGDSASNWDSSSLTINRCRNVRAVARQKLLLFSVPGLVVPRLAKYHASLFCIVVLSAATIPFHC